MKNFDDLYNKHEGSPAVILGSGPSLLDDILDIPVDAILISVNARPMELLPCDYAVYLDKNEGDRVREYPVKKLSPHSGSDYTFPDHIWDGGFSSTSAVYLACHLGCNPVILMGMDLYQGDIEYFDGNKGDKRIAFGRNSTPPIENHIAAWKKALSYCPGADRIRANSGPLIEVFGKYEREELVIGS
ncbi:MAG: hypothetical protein KAR06_11045 [Deltaproteobacteria bacterium]|nr:hypothetical protein [Deltaproteobacteria bacterium]